jgi:hypothetical protein
MNKRGQFFILSAVIIVAAIATLTSVFNSAVVDEEPKSLYDLSENIKGEGFEVIDYALYNGEDKKNTLIEYTDKISNYITNAEPDAEFFFIYGNKDKVVVEDFTKPEIESNIKIQVGDASVFSRANTRPSAFGNRKLYYEEYTNKNPVSITISNQNYKIPLKDGENFIIVMKKTYKSNVYIDLKKG